MPPLTLVETRHNDAHEGTPLLFEKTDYSGKSDFDISENSWFARTLQEMVVQSKTALPALQSMVFSRIPWLISLRFVGGMGAPQLAAAALATTICNVTGMSLSVGLSSALSTLSGQAKGELVSRMLHDKHLCVSFKAAQKTSVTMSPQPLQGSPLNDEPITTPSNQEPITTPCNDEPITTCIFFWRGMIIQLCVMLPVTIWWVMGVKGTLLHLGQTPLLSTMTQDYLRVLAPGLLGYSIGWT
jgi:MatE